MNSLSFLSRYTYSDRLIYLIDLIGRHPAEIRKEYLKGFLAELRDKAHHIYALLEHLPPDMFCVARYFERAAASYDWDFKDAPDIYSIPDFLQNYEQFDENDFFQVDFGSDHFFFELELSKILFIPFYESFIIEHCELGLRHNKPIALTNEVRKKYGLTEEDFMIVGRYLEECNARAAGKIQHEYDTLKNLDCVKK